MLIPSLRAVRLVVNPSLSRRVNANSQLDGGVIVRNRKLIKKGEC